MDGMRHHRLLVVLAAVVLLALVSRIGQESVRLYCSVRPAAPEVAADAAAVARLRTQLRAAETRVRSLEADLRGKCAREAAEPRAADRPGALTPTETFVRTEANLPARAGQMVMMTYATGGVAEMLRNWVRARSPRMPSSHHALSGCVSRRSATSSVSTPLRSSRRWTLPSCASASRSDSTASIGDRVAS